MDTLLKDLRYAFRSLRRQPGFTAVTILTLALGIGANTAVFSVVNGVVLRPLDYPDPDELTLITTQFPALGFDQFWMSIPEYLEFREHNDAFESVGAYSVGAVTLGTETPSRPVRAVVTADLMPTLGVRPVSGRWFEPADEAPGAEPVTVLSWELWQRAFGGADVIDTTTTIDGVSVRVVGIMPAGFDVHDEGVEIWEPLTIDPAQLPSRRGNHFLFMVGRLEDGTTLAGAQADLEILLGRWREIVPSGHVPSLENHRLRFDPLKEDIVGSVSTALVILQGAVAFVLLIACANLANLLIARADARLREYSVRMALGASRGRLLRQLMTEGFLLAFAAALVGTGMAVAGLSVLLSVGPDAIPRTSAIGLDLPVLVFTLVVTVLTGLVFGLTPLLHMARGKLAQGLRDAATRTTASVVRARVRSALVVAEVALAVLLVIGAGLLIRSFVNLTQVDAGFDRSELTTFGVVLPAVSYPPRQRVDFFQALSERLNALPGVQSVAAMTGLPPLRNVNANDTDFEHIPSGRPPDAQPRENVDYYQQVTLGYDETMGIPLVDGRRFDERDLVGSPVVMINETLAQRFFTDRSPLGQELRPGFQGPWFTIVGILKDVKQGGVDADTGTELYFLAPQGPGLGMGAPTQMNVVLRSTRTLDSLAPEIRRQVADLDAAVPIVRLRSMDDVFAASVAQPRFLTLLLGVFAGLALLLAAIGTYGVLAFLVSERRQEIGIRMALGAGRRAVLGMILGRGLLLAGLGLALGLVAAVGLTRILESMLFGVTPTDPATLSLVAVVIVAVAASACLVPAWRATQVSPIIVMKD